jgi:hypothetical protein
VTVVRGTTTPVVPIEPEKGKGMNVNAALHCATS